MRRGWSSLELVRWRWHWSGVSYFLGQFADDKMENKFRSAKCILHQTSHHWQNDKWDVIGINDNSQYRKPMYGYFYNVKTAKCVSFPGVCVHKFTVRMRGNTVREFEAADGGLRLVTVTVPGWARQTSQPKHWGHHNLAAYNGIFSH